MDLTAYVEKHEFCFDAVLDEDVTNDEVKSFSFFLFYFFPLFFLVLEIGVDMS